MRKILMPFFSFWFVITPTTHARAATQTEIVALMNQARATSLQVPSVKNMTQGWFAISFKNSDGVYYKFDMDQWSATTFTLAISIFRTTGESTTAIRIKDTNTDGIIDGAYPGIPVAEWQNEYDRAIVLLRTLMESPPAPR